MSDGSEPVSVINWGQTQAKFIPRENVPQPIRPQPRKEVEQKKKERNIAPISPPAAPENEKHIAKLAQPKKPFPGGPARLNQKKKTVAFGRTVNVSQCIEGKPFAERKENIGLKTEKTMNRPEENKENATAAATTVNKASEKVQKTTQKPVVSDGGDVVTKMQEIMQVLVDKVDKIDKKVDAMETRQIVPASANSTPVFTNFPIGNCNGYRQQASRPRAGLSAYERGILRDLEPMLQANPSFLQAVSDLCNRTEGLRTNDRPSRSRDRFDSPHRSSVVTESIILQRQTTQPLSPTGQPYSTASYNYIMSNDIMSGKGGNVPVASGYHSNDNYRQPSPPRHRPPASNYRSVSHYGQPPRTNYDDNFDLLDDQSVEDDYGSVMNGELPASDYRDTDKRRDHRRRHEARKERMERL